MKARNLLIIALTTLTLAGCSSFPRAGQDGPVGIGSSPNDLKRSPCACLVLPNAGPRPIGASGTLS